MASFSEPLAENSKKLLDRQQTDYVAFGVVIPPLISFDFVEAKDCVTKLYYKRNYYISETNNCSVLQSILHNGVPVVEQVVAGNNITIL